jgi:riboflavin synthase
MFTGIVESLGTITEVVHEEDNIHFTVQSNISAELKIDQSVAHNGVCLTVVKQSGYTHVVTAIRETLNKTNLKSWKAGSLVNLERCMPAHGRFDGHIVQGHVDQTARCTSITEEGGSWRLRFEFDPSQGNMVVEKGSICLNGISLTVVDATENGFAVAIIPYTWEHTNLQQLQVGAEVNLEFDILGKYMQAILKRQQA